MATLNQVKGKEIRISLTSNLVVNINEGFAYCLSQ